MYYTITWKNEIVSMIDQTILPVEETYIDCPTSESVARAIETMVIRGAPAIGVAAAMGVALGAKEANGENPGAFLSDLRRVISRIARTRPTAINLFWALDRMETLAVASLPLGISETRRILREESQRILDEDIRANQAMGKFGAELISHGETILTHCNAGGLATGGYGTALGVIRAAFEAGKEISVFADETRPLLQGARLTAWELQKLGIPVTLITDNMAGHFMKSGKIDRVITGADRVASNGDAANKIGTYPVAVLAKEHGIPFHIAAPVSTIDFSILSGEEIPIEERKPEEVFLWGGRQTAPTGIKIANPAFDVTPCRLIQSIITEKGVIQAPYRESISALKP